MLQVNSHLQETIRNAGRTLGFAVVERHSPESTLDAGSDPGCVVTGMDSLHRTDCSIQRLLLDGHSPLAVIFVATEASVSQTVLAMKLGAANVLQTPLSPQQLTVEIRDAVQLSEKRAEHIRKVKEARSLLDELTTRERETLPGVLSGRTNDSIASQLSVSTRTIERRRRSILERLGVDCFAAVVRVIDVAAQPLYPFLEDSAEPDSAIWTLYEEPVDRSRDRPAFAAAEVPPHADWQATSRAALTPSRMEPVGVARVSGQFL